MTAHTSFLLLLFSSLPVYALDARFSERVNAIHDGADASVVLRVMDADGLPVADADVWAGFACNAKGKSSSKSSVTDTNGLVTLTGLTSGQVIYRITKDGYYSTEGRCNFGEAMPPVVNGRWQPWDATNRTVLKQVKAPVAMYAKRVESHLPSLNGPCAYDLEIGDWVAPYGKGETDDIVFSITRKRVLSWTDFDASLLISFGGGENGFCQLEDECSSGSVFGWAYDAPTKGYLRSWVISMGYVPEQGFYERNQVDHCYIRVRATTNEANHTVVAKYGKISGRVVFDVRDSPTAWLKFTYYLNPTPNDRNIEFDPKRNLFKDLKSSEEVEAP